MYCSNPFGGKSFESFRSAAEVNKHKQGQSHERSVINGAIHIHCHLQVGLTYLVYSVFGTHSLLKLGWPVAADVSHFNFWSHLGSKTSRGRRHPRSIYAGSAAGDRGPVFLGWEMWEQFFSLLIVRVVFIISRVKWQTMIEILLKTHSSSILWYSCTRKFHEFSEWLKKCPDEIGAWRHLLWMWLSWLRWDQGFGDTRCWEIATATVTDVAWLMFEVGWLKGWVAGSLVRWLVCRVSNVKQTLILLINKTPE